MQSDQKHNLSDAYFQIKDQPTGGGRPKTRIDVRVRYGIYKTTPNFARVLVMQRSASVALHEKGIR